MNRAIILHGITDYKECHTDKYPSLSNFHWIPWLQKQLLINDVFTQTPEMPKPWKAKYNKWKKEFERYHTDDTKFLVGHSAGSGFLVRWLSENTVKPEKLVLVAPWMDPISKNSGNFFNFKIDKTLQERVKEIHIFFSKDEDVIGVKETVDILMEAFPLAFLHTFENYGHFTKGDMNSTEFPELRDVILNQHKKLA